MTDLTLTELSTTAQTALRAIQTLRQYGLPNLQEAERTVLAKLSVEDCTAVILALSESQENRSPSERVKSILDRLVRSAQSELQTQTDQIIKMRTTLPDIELTVDPKKVLQEVELRYKNRTSDFIRALVRAGLSENVIAGLWPIFERSKKDKEQIARSIRQIGKTMVLTANPDRFELSNIEAVLAHIEATFDDLEIQDIETLSKDTYRRTFKSREAVINYLRTSGVLDVPEIDVCLTA